MLSPEISPWKVFPTMMRESFGPSAGSSYVVSSQALISKADVMRVLMSISFPVVGVTKAVPEVYRAYCSPQPRIPKRRRTRS